MTTQIKGYTTMKGDKFHHMGLERSKKDLLIGYDLITLVGLDKCEQRLQSKGIEVKRVTASITDENDYTCYAATINNELHIDSLAYTTCKTDPEDSFLTAAIFLSDWPTVNDEDQAALKRYYHFWLFLRHDGRRRRTGERLKATAEKIMVKYGVLIVPIKLIPDRLL